MSRREAAWAAQDDKRQAEYRRDDEIQREKDKAEALEQPAYTYVPYDSLLLWGYWTKWSDDDPSEYDLARSEEGVRARVRELNGGTLPKLVNPSTIGPLYKRLKEQNWR